MKFLVGFSICAENRGIVEEILQRIVDSYTISNPYIQTLGPEKGGDKYVPKLTVIERDLGWCLQLDGEDQVEGISAESMDEEYKIRRETAFHVGGSDNLEEYHTRVKELFILLLQLNLGDNEYFSDHDDVERMRALVAWSFSNPLAIISKEDREAVMRGEHPEILNMAPPKDQMN